MYRYMYKQVYNGNFFVYMENVKRKFGGRVAFLFGL
jgi:hypothetical protein